MIDCHVILEASENVLPLVIEHIALNPSLTTPTFPGRHYGKRPVALIADFPILCAMNPPFQSCQRGKSGHRATKDQEPDLPSGQLVLGGILCNIRRVVQEALPSGGRQQDDRQL